MKTYRISGREAGQRMDKYLLRLLGAAPQSFVYRMLRKKNIVLNGKKAAGSEILREGDEVRLYLADDTIAKFSAAPAAANCEGEEIEIVYEDEDILIFNKPAGLLSQKAKPQDDSANDRFLSYLRRSGQITEEELLTFHPSICNRLDRNTSGLLIAGKTMRGLQETSALLKGRNLRKFYRALVAGRVKEELRLSGYLRKNERENQVEIYPDGRGEPVRTNVVPLSVFGDATLVEAELITGRSHQIRAHLASVGHPILGDPKYGDADRNRELARATGIQSQLLCACRMEFPDGRIVSIEEPDSFRKAEAFLKQRGEEERQGGHLPDF